MKTEFPSPVPVFPTASRDMLSVEIACLWVSGAEGVDVRVRLASSAGTAETTSVGTREWTLAGNARANRMKKGDLLIAYDLSVLPQGWGHQGAELRCDKAEYMGSHDHDSTRNHVLRMAGAVPSFVRVRSLDDALVEAKLAAATEADLRSHPHQAVVLAWRDDAGHTHGHLVSWWGPRLEAAVRDRGHDCARLELEFPQEPGFWNVEQHLDGTRHVHESQPADLELGEGHDMLALVAETTGWPDAPRGMSPKEYVATMSRSVPGVRVP